MTRTRGFMDLVSTHDFNQQTPNHCKLRFMPMLDTMERQMNAIQPPSQVAHKTFPFEKLPPELREMIYGCLVIRDRLDIRLHDSHGRPLVTSLYHDTSPLGKHGTAILRVGKLTYSEAKPLLYSKNIYHFEFPSEVSPLLSYLRYLPFSLQRPRTDFIKHMAIGYLGGPSFDNAMRSCRSLANLRSLTIDILSVDARAYAAGRSRFEGLFAGALWFIDMAASVSVRQNQLDKISFTVSNGVWEWNEALNEIPKHVPTELKARLAELAGLPRKELCETNK